MLVPFLDSASDEIVGWETCFEETDRTVCANYTRCSVQSRMDIMQLNAYTDWLSLWRIFMCKVDHILCAPDMLNEHMYMKKLHTPAYNWRMLYKWVIDD